jgi:hypothetical protein
MVSVPGFEPGTSSLSGTRSNQLSYTLVSREVPGLPDRPERTARPLSADRSPLLRRSLVEGMVELRGFEPLTSSLQSWRSSQLSYSPVVSQAGSRSKEGGMGGLQPLNSAIVQWRSIWFAILIGWVLRPARPVPRVALLKGERLVVVATRKARLPTA